MEMLVKLNRHPSANSCISKSVNSRGKLCYGWIDSQADSFDDQHWLVRFTSRRSRSKWSKINRVKESKLIEEGRMKPAGLREVELAKAEGRWEE
jgi:uncharacterized protein YdeI (YjbR/CyaY-like superfamily)